MNINFKYFFILLTIAVSHLSQTINGSAIHVLAGLNYENPAALNRVKHCEIILGDDYVNTRLRFRGTSFGVSGKAISSVHDHLPYGQIAYRINDKIVLGVAYLQYVYGNIKWGADSLVRFASTQTTVNSYKIATRLSYQLTEKLAVGFAFDINRNYNFQLNFAVPGLGNVRNRSLTPIYFGYDFGIFYVINPDTFLNTAVYVTSKNVKQHGTSSSQSGLKNDNYSIHGADCLECYVQLIRNVTEKFLIAGKVTYSKWNIEKHLDFTNTVIGDINVPTVWNNSWTIECAGQYKINDTWSLIAAGEYVTNFSKTRYNALGYPGGDVLSGVAGFSTKVNECLTAQLLYVHGIFIPEAKIDDANNKGRISLNNNILALKLTYAY
jgi:long-chain fatty acid transport protein